VRDISCTGVALVVEGYLEVGTFLSITVPARGPGRPLRACVVRTQRIAPRTWLLGCVLNPWLSSEELHALL
jgi:hypothetical protein